LFDAVEHDHAAALQDVIELGGAFVVVELRVVDIDSMRPGSGTQCGVFVADEKRAVGGFMMKRKGMMRKITTSTRCLAPASAGAFFAARNLCRVG